MDGIIDDPSDFCEIRSISTIQQSSEWIRAFLACCYTIPSTDLENHPTYHTRGPTCQVDRIKVVWMELLTIRVTFARFDQFQLPNNQPSGFGLFLLVATLFRLPTWKTILLTIPASLCDVSLDTQHVTPCRT
jgi:hypothetical protein